PSYIPSLIIYCHAYQRKLHSFPTRRSSDLENTSEQEKETYVEEGDPTTHDTDYKSRPELLDKMETVIPHSDNRWAVQSKDAKKPTKTFDNKSDAIDYGKHIAQNKQTGIIIYKSDGTKQQTIHYNE